MSESKPPKGLETQPVEWTLETDPMGQWALFIRVAGTRLKVSQWYPSRDALVADMAAALTASKA